ncbi:MAG: DUF6498-containing protein [Thermoflexibacter sp.]|jgi:hypothetical protein|nr:DUF6498-containing protein [Thermoflexibacter sp.]
MDKQIFKNYAFWLILLANLLLIIDYQTHWVTAMMIIIAYWLQSVIIGFFHFLRILLLKQFNTENFTLNGEAVSPNSKINIGMAFFFAVHYGIFHVALLLFTPFIFMNLKEKDKTDSYISQLSFIPIQYLYHIALIFFFVSQLLLFFKHLRMDKINPPNIGTMMFTPYPRIIPFFLSVLAGAHINGGSAFLIFLIVKLIVDLIMFILKKV